MSVALTFTGSYSVITINNLPHIHHAIILMIPIGWVPTASFLLIPAAF